MQIGEIVRVSANVCTCNSANIPQFWCLPRGQLCVNPILPFCTHAAKEGGELSFPLITSQNCGFGLRLWKNPIDRFELITKIQNSPTASNLRHRENLHVLIQERLKEVGINAASKSGLSGHVLGSDKEYPSSGPSLSIWTKKAPGDAGSVALL